MNLYIGLRLTQFFNLQGADPDLCRKVTGKFLHNLSRTSCGQLLINANKPHKFMLYLPQIWFYSRGEMSISDQGSV